MLTVVVLGVLLSLLTPIPTPVSTPPSSTTVSPPSPSPSLAQQPVFHPPQQSTVEKPFTSWKNWLDHKFSVNSNGFLRTPYQTISKWFVGQHDIGIPVEQTNEDSYLVHSQLQEDSRSQFYAPFSAVADFFGGISHGIGRMYHAWNELYLMPESRLEVNHQLNLSAENNSLPLMDQPLESQSPIGFVTDFITNALASGMEKLMESCDFILHKSVQVLFVLGLARYVFLHRRKLLYDAQRSYEEAVNVWNRTVQYHAVQADVYQRRALFLEGLPRSLPSQACTICIDDDNAEAAVTLNCNHEFHLHCILKWSQCNGHACPVCRAPFEPDTEVITPEMTARNHHALSRTLEVCQIESLKFWSSFVMLIIASLVAVII
jgi:hypothetical protein